MTQYAMTLDDAPDVSLPDELPASQNAERDLLACLMLVPDTWGEVSAIVKADQFRWHDNRLIFEAVAHLHAKGLPVDPTQVAERLVATSAETDRTYWYAELRKLMEEQVPHAGNVKYYAMVVREHWLRRQTTYDLTKVIQRANHIGQDIDDVLNDAAGVIQNLLEAKSGNQAVPLSESLVDVLQALERTEPPGISTGFVGLDRLTGGFKPGSMIVLAARPSMGKTAFAANTAQHIARSGPVLFFSLEQTRAELSTRMLSGQLGVPTDRLRALARGDDLDRERLLDGTNELSRLPLLIDDRHGRTIAEMTSQARIARRKSPLKLIVIDYLQLAKPADSRAIREVQVAQMSRDVKAMAKALDVPVLCLAQMNRQSEARAGEDRRPRLSDIRESGAVEQDADVVLMPHRADPKNDPESVTLIVAKNRNGARGDVPLVWDGPTMTFSDPAPPARDEWGLPGSVDL